MKQLCLDGAKQDVTPKKVSTRHLKIWLKRYNDGDVFNSSGQYIAYKNIFNVINLTWVSAWNWEAYRIENNVTNESINVKTLDDAAKLINDMLREF